MSPASGGAQTAGGGPLGGVTQEWLTVSEAERLVDESASTIRRHVKQDRVRHRTRRVNGRDVTELHGTDVWAWRQRKLRRLGVTVDPMRRPGAAGAEPAAADPDDLLTRLAGAEAALAQMTAARDQAQSEVRRVTAALEVMFAADDAQDDRVRAAEGQVQAAAERVRVADERSALLKGAARSLMA